MLIGMTMDKEKEMIVPFTEGEYVRVFNSDTGNLEDAKNPSLHLSEGRRGVVVNWFYEQGVELICSPPNTFCELSYENAKEKKMSFYTFEKDISFLKFKRKLEAEDISLTSHIKKENILKSN